MDKENKSPISQIKEWGFCLGQKGSKTTMINTLKSYGGISVTEFLKKAMEAIRTDMFEAAVSHAKNLQEKREALFPV
jgi:hypothetical protein